MYLMKICAMTLLTDAHQYRPTVRRPMSASTIQLKRAKAARYTTDSFSTQTKAPQRGILFGTLVFCFLLFTDTFSAPTVQPVKRSSSGICHDRDSPSYSATKRFEFYDSLEQCLKAGGRLPKNLPHAQQLRTADSQESSSENVGPNPKLIMVAFASVAIVCAGGVWLWRRRARQDDPDDALARRKWEGHRLESSDDEIFKRRPHRWDPWLKRIGYFDKNRKP